MDNAALGSIENKRATEVWDIIEGLSKQSARWDSHDRRRRPREEYEKPRSRELYDEHKSRDSYDEPRRGRDPLDDSRSSREPLPRGRGVYEVAIPSDGVVTSKLEQLEKKMEQLLERQDRASPVSQAKVVYSTLSTCLLCESPSHVTQECPLAPQYPDFVEEQARMVGNFQGRQQKNDPYSPTYNPGWRNHPNFSWGGNQGGSSSQGSGSYSHQGQGGSNYAQRGTSGSTLVPQGQGAYYGASHSQFGSSSSNFGPHSTQGQPLMMHGTHGNAPYSYGSNAQNVPPGFVQGSGYGNTKFQGSSSAFHGANQGGNYATLPSNEPNKPGVEELMSKFIEVQSSTNAINKQAIDSLQVSVHKLETQVGQMASSMQSRNQGSLPSNTRTNPRHNEQAKAISILRSGKVYDNKVRMPHSSSHNPLHMHDDMCDPSSSSSHSHDRVKPNPMHAPNSPISNSSGEYVMVEDCSSDDSDFELIDATMGEENVPHGNVDNYLIVHDFDLMADGNQGEENVPPGIGVGVVTLNTKGRNKGVDKEAGEEENVLPGSEQGKKTSLYHSTPSRAQASTSSAPPKHVHFAPNTHSSSSKGFHQERSNKEENYSHVPSDLRDRSGPVYSTLGEALRAKNPSGTVTILRGPRGSLTFSPPLDLTPSKLSLPYPNAARRDDSKRAKKKSGLMREIHDIFKKVNVNIPLVDLIRQVPAYAQFLKSLCMNKKKFKDDETFVLNEEVSAIIQRRLPPKMQDPGSFTIGCTIGESVFEGALMDLGASVNLLPLVIFKKLQIGELKPTSIRLQLADQSTRFPVGVVEDVLVRVDKFILPADFVVLDMGEDPHLNNELPIILGRPFMATAGVKINVLKGTITFKVLVKK